MGMRVRVRVVAVEVHAERRRSGLWMWRLVEIEHGAVQCRKRGEALRGKNSVSKGALRIRHRRTDLVLGALCVEHGEQHFSVAVALCFVCLQNFAEGWRRSLCLACES